MKNKKIYKYSIIRIYRRNNKGGKSEMLTNEQKKLILIGKFTRFIFWNLVIILSFLIPFFIWVMR